jgi:hypothetical protein
VLVFQIDSILFRWDLGHGDDLLASESMNIIYEVMCCCAFAHFVTFFSCAAREPFYHGHRPCHPRRKRCCLGLERHRQRKGRRDEEVTIVCLVESSETCCLIYPRDVAVQFFQEREEGSRATILCQTLLKGLPSDVQDLKVVFVSYVFP